jgi:hypothetical protein
MKKTIKKILREFEDDWGWAKDLNPINIFKGVFYIDVDGLTKGEKHNVIKKIFDLGFSFLPITGFSDNDYNSEIKGYLLVNDVYKKRALFKDTQKFSNTPRVEGLPLDTYLSSQEFLDIAKTLLKESEDDGLGWIRDSEMGESITNLKSGDYFKITIIDGDSLEDYIGDNDLSEIDPYTKIFVVLYFTRVYGDEHYGFSDTYREKDTDVLIRPIDGVGGWVRVDGLFVEKYNFKTEPNINESENDGLDWIREVPFEFIPEVGDKVRCKPGFSEYNNAYQGLPYGGSGYVQNKVFVVDDVKEVMDGVWVAWPVDSPLGVYTEALEPYVD